SELALDISANPNYLAASPCPQKGDASRSSRNVGAGCDGRCGVRCVKACPAKSLRRTAKSCGPGAATVASIHAGPCWRGNGDNQRRSPGRARISRQTIARGKPGCLGCTCLIRVRFLFSLHTVLRAQSAPGFPCALSSERDNEITELGQIMSRERCRLFEKLNQQT